MVPFFFVVTSSSSSSSVLSNYFYSSIPPPFGSHKIMSLSLKKTFSNNKKRKELYAKTEGVLKKKVPMIQYIKESILTKLDKQIRSDFFTPCTYQMQTHKHKISLSNMRGIKNKTQKIDSNERLHRLTRATNKDFCKEIRYISY